MPFWNLFGFRSLCLKDIVIVAHPSVAEQTLAILKAEMTPFCGLDVNPAQTQAWTPDWDAPPGSLREHWAPHGITLLGGSLSREDSLDPGSLGASQDPAVQHSGERVVGPIERPSRDLVDAVMADRTGADNLEFSF